MNLRGRFPGSLMYTFVSGGEHHHPGERLAPGGANLLVRIHFIIVMIRWTGLAPWEFEFQFPGSLISTFLCVARNAARRLSRGRVRFPDLLLRSYQNRFL